MRLVWLDLETTGLDPSKDRILEVAVAAADLLDPFNVEHLYQQVVRCSPEEASGFDPFIVGMHTANGLLAQCAQSPIAIGDIERALLDLVPHVEDKEERPILAGSSIHFDHAFIKVHMPQLSKRLSHRHYDVSALKLFCQSQGMPKFKKAEAHRAKADIDESVAHGAACAQWLKDNLRQGS
jgi:oligoribonuclease